MLLPAGSNKPSELACSTWSPSGDFFLCPDFILENYQGSVSYNNILQAIWKQCSYTIPCTGKLDSKYRNPQAQGTARCIEDDPYE